MLCRRLLLSIVAAATNCADSIPTASLVHVSGRLAQPCHKAARAVQRLRFPVLAGCLCTAHCNLCSHESCSEGCHWCVCAGMCTWPVLCAPPTLATAWPRWICRQETSRHGTCLVQSQVQCTPLNVASFCATACLAHPRTACRIFQLLDVASSSISHI